MTAIAVPTVDQAIEDTRALQMWAAVTVGMLLAAIGDSVPAQVQGAFWVIGLGLVVHIGRLLRAVFKLWARGVVRHMAEDRGLDPDEAERRYLQEDD